MSLCASAAANSEKVNKKKWSGDGGGGDKTGNTGSVPATRAATAATPQDGTLSPGDNSTSPNVTRRRKRAVEDGNWRLCRSRLAFLALSVSLSYGRAPKYGSLQQVSHGQVLCTSIHASGTCAG